MNPPFTVLHMMPDLAVGGGQVLLLRNIRALQRHEPADPAAPRFRHVVCAVSDRDMTLAPDYRGAGVEVHTLRASRRRHHPVALVRLLGLMRGSKIDLVHTNNTTADLTLGQMAAAIMRRPRVNTFHGQPPAFTPVSRSRALRLSGRGPLGLSLRDWLLTRTSVFVAVSEDLRAGWTPYLGALGIPPDRLVAITPGIAIEDAPPIEDGPLPPRSGPILLAVSRLVAGKGIEHLTPVMQHVLAERPDAALWVAGDGPLRADLERSIAHAGIGERVHVLGVRHDVPAIMSACDVFLFPTHAEGFGLVALEAMAAGRPVVASDLPVLRQIVEHDRTGLLVPPRDPGTIAAAVLELLRNPERCREMGAAGRERVRDRFSDAEVAAALRAVYLRAIGGASPPRSDTGRSASIVDRSAA